LNSRANPSIKTPESGHAITQPYPTLDTSPLIRRSSRQPTPARKNGSATQAVIQEAIEGGEGMEGIEATPPRKVIQEGTGHG